MRYTHSFRLIRKRKHTVKISALISLGILFLTLVVGFTELDASFFFIGFLESFARVCLSYLISLILGVAVCFWITSSSKIESIFLPILDVLQSFPSFALFPLLTAWLGASSGVTIVILVIAMIWPILFTLLSSHKQIKPDLLEAAHVFGATGKKFWVYVLMPLFLPAIITGSIVAWGEAWETIIAAEIIVKINGIGTYLALLGEKGQTPTLTIGILLLLMLLFLFNKYVWLPLLNYSTRYFVD